MNISHEIRMIWHDGRVYYARIGTCDGEIVSAVQIHLGGSFSAELARDSWDELAECVPRANRLPVVTLPDGVKLRNIEQFKRRNDG